MKISFVTQWSRRLASVGASALLLAALGVMPAHAVQNDGFFELDGNVADSPAGGADDWNNFPNAAPCGTNCTNTSHTSKATGIVSDTINPPAVFRNGSKDTQDISAWRYDLGSSPPKDDMLHAYAAAYTATNAIAGKTDVGDLLIYFGADRAAFSGTASLGFWFFKKEVVQNNGSFFIKGTTTPATHSIGDVLVAFEYTNGGAVTGVKTFVWTAGGLQENPPLGSAPTGTPGVYCDPADKVCGTTNDTALNLPWNGTVQLGQFFEGGVNVTKLIPNSDACFSSFMATSRSSDTAVASIKNFILSSFPVCHLNVTKVCPDPGVYDTATNTIAFTVMGRVLNDGGGPLSTITVTDSPTNFTSLGYFTCDANGLPTTTPLSNATLAVNASICYRGTYSSTSYTAIDTVTARAAGGVSGTATATCTLPPTGLTLYESCNLDLVAANNALALKVNLKGAVVNTGGVALAPVKVCYTPEGALTQTCTTIAASLEVGGTAPYAISYTPSVASSKTALSALLNPHEAFFNAKIEAIGTPPSLFNVSDVKVGPHDVQCGLCDVTNE